MNTSRAACGRSIRATPVFVVCGSRMKKNSSPCKCGCESRPSWRSGGIRTTFSGEPMDQSALTDTSRLTATTWDRKRGRGGQFSGITLHRNLAPRFKALANFSSMGLGGALGNTRALTFLALKVLRWVANWGRTAVVEAMACIFSVVVCADMFPSAGRSRIRGKTGPPSRGKSCPEWRPIRVRLTRLWEAVRLVQAKIGPTILMAKNELTNPNRARTAG